MGLIKLYYHPLTGVQLTDSNTKFVVTYAGSDSNTGTRYNPFKTLTRAISFAPQYICFSGDSNENTNGFSVCNVISASDGSYISGVVNNSSNAQTIISNNMIFANVIMYQGGIKNCIINDLSGLGKYFSSINSCILSECFVTTLRVKCHALTRVYGYDQNTIINYINYISISGSAIFNSIISNSIDLYNYTSCSNTSYFPIFKNCLFRRATVWKWNGVTIPINFGTYGNVEGDYLSDVISGLYAFANSMVAGQDKNYFLAMIPTANSSNIFYVDVNGQTCKVVEDRPSILGSKKIFNRYVNDSPVDYSLYLSSDNVALTMSDQLSHVGCYKANAKVLTFGEVMHVNVDGSDDLLTVPDMLISDGNGKFHVSTADSVQTRNRVRSDVFNFKRGFNLTAFQSQIKSGLGSRFSMGKFQPYNITDAPTLPQESIEILPYDDENIPSAFPRFSGMFNGECKMWYHTIGAKINQPVLFNDLQSFFTITTDKSLAEYGTWAVTNADFETYLLSSKTGVALRNIPVYYGRIELNLNYHI